MTRTRILIFTGFFVAFISGALNASAQEFGDDTWAEVEEGGMTLFAPYIGDWRGSDYETQDGRTFHFELEYAWFDYSQSIVKLSIKRVLEGEGPQLQWEGYYGIDPVGNHYFYHGYAGDGRVVVGGVYEVDGDENRRVTVLHGRTQDGTPLIVRDAFTLNTSDAFTSETSLRIGDGDWRTVSEDTYRRM